MLNLVCEKIAALELPSYVKDSQLRYVAVNAAFARLYGLPETSFPGRSDQDMLGTSADALRDDRERRVLVFGDEECLPFSAGGAPHRLLRIERFFDDDERLFLFGLVEAEAAPREPNMPANDAPAKVPPLHLPKVDVFKAVLEQFPLASYVRDSQHRLVFANPAFVEMVGRPLEDLLGGVEVENFPEMGESYFLGNSRVLATGVTEEVHDLFVGADGRKIPILSRTGVVDGPDGTRYIVGSITDLSQVRRGEEQYIAATRQAEDMRHKFESLLTSLPVGILVLDSALHVEYINAAMIEMFEFATEQTLLGKYYGDLLWQTFARSKSGATEEEIRERVSFRLDQLRCLDNGPIIDVKTPSGRALAGSSRKIAGRRVLITFSDVSDVAQREEETLLYRAALEQMPVPVFIRDTERRLIYVNAAYEELHDQRREDIYGLTEEEMWPEAGERLKAENIRILDHGERIERAADVILRDGKEISVITRLNRITTAADKHYLVGSVNDVSIIKTGQRALMEAQAQAEALYQDILAMLRIMPVGVVILDGDYMVEFANQKCRDIWMWPETLPLQGLSFRSYCEVNHGHGHAWPGVDFEDGYRARIAQFDKLEGSHSTTLSYDDGKEVLATVTRLRDRKILLTYADLTEMRQREREVSAAQQQVERLGHFMRDTMRLTSQGVGVIEHGRIADINPAFMLILGLPEDLIEGDCHWRTIFDFCRQRGDFGDDPDEILEQLQQSLLTTGGASATFLADGRTWVKLDATLGEGDSCVVILTDITGVKAREAELEVLLARSEAADKAKSDFLANMSHEIRTPMNGVLGMAELLSKSELDSRQKTFVDIVVKSGNALLTIINDILDFSKIDAGQMKLRKSPFDPVEAVEDVATLLSAAAAEKDIELVVSGDQTVRHTFLGDPGRFRQIVTNLLGNAIKFTEHGHVHVEVSSDVLPGEQSVLRLRIEDTGIGIPEDMQAKIFEKFSQADTSSTRRHEGTGLGLAITGGLVKLFGGRMRVESEVGRGSVFIVELPMPVVAERSRSRELPANVKDARVLVIDDNVVNRRIISEQLAMWGFDGLAVPDGPSGLDILDEAHRAGLAIDLVVIDYQMPEMNGLDVAKAIRNDPRFDETSLIFLTSMDMAGDERLYESLRIQAHLMKPARANVLRGAIIDVIRGARVHGAMAARSKVPVHASMKASIAPVVPQAPVTSAPAGHAGDLLKVLIAEDNPVNQIVFRQILAGSDIAYRIVANGEEALNAWRDERPDLILMDVSMPVMNGHRATEAIRREEAAAGSGEHVPIIGVTAHAMASDREACLASGMDDYLSKPISPELLMRKIEEWADHGPPASASADGY